ncbi:hypothetical protein Cagg_1992 [Chloroflexus aggregans DSM 9485]|uniref:Glycosyltransferase RgtA/B/C/D-like domain-containing protein n=2 Tax=Chloroflexus aggregans TaxID=152260 RepID=B8GBR3_CHLAD|nr:hypothetical protein Cagg_1992 [Chloroflexus aggregans DSM 9485]
MHTSQSMRGKKLFIDAAIICFLIMAWFKLCMGIESSLEVDTAADETLYLYSGITQTTPADYGPLYGLWYWLLWWTTPDRIDLYYLNWRMTTLLPVLAFYLICRLNRVTPLVSAVAAWLLLISSINVSTWPRVSHLALFIVLLSLSAISLLRSRSRSSLAIATGLLAASYVRPELFLSYVAGLGVVLIDLIRDYRQKQLLPWLTMIITGFVQLALLIWQGVPMTGERSFVAFSQHFATSWITWNNSQLDPWNDFPYIMQTAFGDDVDTVWEAFLANPMLILRHMVQNVIRLYGIATLLPVGVVHYSATADRIDKLFLWVVLFTALGVFLMTLHLIRRSISELLFRKEHNRLRVWIIICTLLVFISIISIYPRPHYLLLLILPLLFFVIVVYTANQPLTPPRLPELVLTVSLMFLLTPMPWWSTNNQWQTPALRFLNTLNSVQQAQLTVLVPLDIAGLYIPTFKKIIAYHENGNEFMDLLDEADIVIIGSVSSSETIRRFTSYPQQYGFEPILEPYIPSLFIRSEHRQLFSTK